MCYALRPKTPETKPTAPPEERQSVSRSHRAAGFGASSYTVRELIFGVVLVKFMADGDQKHVQTVGHHSLLLSWFPG